MVNTGKDYELFVSRLQQAIIDSESISDLKNINVEVDKIITDNHGIDRQFDIYWEYEIGGFIYKTVIECKDYKSRVSIDKIDSLIGKTQDIPDLRLVFATKNGYQSVAIMKANKHKIDLLIVREQNSTDWENENGDPLIKKIITEINIIQSPIINKFEPFIAQNWIEENTSYDVDKPIRIDGLYNEIVIENKKTEEEYTLQDLINRLTSLKNNQFGTFKLEKKFENAYIKTEDIYLKILGYKIEYTINKPIKKTIEIDFSKELLGVIEYLGRGLKRLILSDGKIKEFIDGRI